MKNKWILNAILFLIILFFCLLCIFIATFVSIKEKETDTSNIQISAEAKPENIEQAVVKHNAKYINENENKIYVEFPVDLYDDTGKSSESYFYGITEEVKPFFERKNFYLIDENLNIKIYMKYNTDLSRYEMLINEQEDFYTQTDGKSFVEVESVSIVKGTHTSTKDTLLNKLKLNSNYLSSIEEELGEGIELENGYTSYLNETVEIRTVATGGVKNIIFKNGYEGEIISGVNTEMSLNEIKDVFPENDFGGLSSNYLGYRQVAFYFFFYDDEVSAYTYSYKKNTKFEEILSEYIENGDLEKFVKKLQNNWKSYDSLEYNPETQSAKIMYSTRGVEIDIKDNNPKGITLYSNYYFTDYTKQLVKNGFVNFDGDTDLVDKVERERRESVR